MSGKAVTDIKPSKVEYIKPSFKLHRFENEIGETKLIYQVLKMVDSLLIFINIKQNLTLDSLYLSIIDKYTGNSNYTRLIGNFSDEDSSKVISCTLAKKLKKPVLVSCNLGSEISSVLIIKQIIEEISRKPDSF